MKDAFLSSSSSSNENKSCDKPDDEDEVGGVSAFLGGVGLNHPSVGSNTRADNAVQCCHVDNACNAC